MFLGSRQNSLPRVDSQVIASDLWAVCALRGDAIKDNSTTTPLADDSEKQAVRISGVGREQGSEID